MAKNRKDAWDEYRRTGVNNSNFDLNDRDEIAAITGWNCARDKGRADAFRKYHRTGVNHSEYDLTDHDQISSILNDRKNRR
ncbi:MAG: hypothetical protein HDT06_06200 [Bacteroidales bacterium]|nr:hypothetical protein [Bacteroidales bacterium]